MAKLLVRQKDNFREGVLNDVPYRPGDVVAIMPDRYIPSKKEMQPNFFWVYLIGIPVRDMTRLLLPEYHIDQEGPWNENRLIVQRRLYKVDEKRMTGVVRSLMRSRPIETLHVNTGGGGDMSKLAFENIVINKLSNQSINAEGRSF